MIAFDNIDICHDLFSEMNQQYDVWQKCFDLSL
jgi:hypothetical protein